MPSTGQPQLDDTTGCIVPVVSCNSRDVERSLEGARRLSTAAQCPAGTASRARARLKCFAQRMCMQPCSRVLEARLVLQLARQHMQWGTHPDQEKLNSLLTPVTRRRGCSRTHTNPSTRHMRKPDRVFRLQMEPSGERYELAGALCTHAGWRSQPSLAQNQTARM
jgi:hypothetical protein